MGAEHRPFIRHLQGKGLAERSVDEYRKFITRGDRWLDTNLDVRLQQAHPWQIRRWVEDDVPYSWSSRKQVRTALGHWQEFANHPDDLAGAVPVPAKPKPKPKPLDPADTQRLELCAFTRVVEDGGRDGMATLLGLYLGMRRGAIARAVWTSDGGDEWVWRRDKGGSVHSVPIHPRLRQALDCYESVSTYLFVGNEGQGPVHVNTVWQWVRDLGGQVNVEVTPHRLRHSFGTKVVSNHGIRVGQELLGHARPETTARYSQVADQRKREAVESLDWSA